MCIFCFYTTGAVGGMAAIYDNTNQKELNTFDPKFDETIYDNKENGAAGGNNTNGQLDAFDMSES